MEFIVYSGYIAFILVPVWWWKKYRDRKYLLLTVPGVVLLMISISVRVSETFSQQSIQLGLLELSLSTVLQLSALVAAGYMAYKIY